MGKCSRVGIWIRRKQGAWAGVIAGDSAICLCGAEEESLRYRGYAIEDLAAKACFEEGGVAVAAGRVAYAEGAERL